MKANQISVNQFLTLSNTTFIIPVYQRNYDWKKEQCKQLLDDILKIGQNDKIQSHFIGSIVYVSDNVYNDAGVRELIIIDGQQRLTTLTLIYITIYKLAQELKNEKLVKHILLSHLLINSEKEEDKLKLKVTENNQKALIHILKENDINEFKNHSRIIENFKYFQSQINSENLEIIQKGLFKLIFVDMELQTDDNPQRIFESLNSTGLALSQADLIRNYILMDLKPRIQNKIYNNYWKIIEDLAKNEENNKNILSDFIRDFLTLENKKIPNEGKVYLEFKEKYPAEERTEQELEEILNKLKLLVRFYNKLINPKNEPDKEIRIQLEYIKKLEINVAYPFLMKVYEDFGNKLIDKNTFIQILELIQSYTFRRFIVGVPTAGLNKTFMSLYKEVDKQNYLYSIQKSLVQKSGSQRFPRNEETARLFKEKDIYNIKKDKNYLFKRLENFENKELVLIDENITIEHIFPQNPDPQWKKDLNIDEYNFIKNNYLNTIGNLTLSGNNGKLSNKSFLEKKSMNVKDKEGKGGEQGYIFSRLWLNRDLQQIEKWNKAEIEKRAENMAKRFLKVWKLPEININQEIEEIQEEINIFEAEDPTNRQIEYAVFQGEKIEPDNMADFYIIIMRKLFELQPEAFINTDLSKKLKILTNKSEYGILHNKELSDIYFILTHLGNLDKFNRIKEVLRILELEDELFIKYKN